MQSKVWIRCVMLMAALVIQVGCGKYGKPRSPEHYAPAEVRNLSVTPSVEGIKFAWVAPEKDVRSKELDNLEGYRVYRREMPANGQAHDPYARFDLLSEIQDTHVAELLEQKQQAIEQGVLTKRVSVDPERYKFEYTDVNVSAGKRYLYQIVPINHGGVEGKVTQRIQIVYRGELSEVTTIPYTPEDIEL